MKGRWFPMKSDSLFGKASPLKKRVGTRGLPGCPLRNNDPNGGTLFLALPRAHGFHLCSGLSTERSGALRPEASPRDSTSNLSASFRAGRSGCGAKTISKCGRVFTFYMFMGFWMCRFCCPLFFPCLFKWKRTFSNRLSTLCFTTTQVKLLGT